MLSDFVECEFCILLMIEAHFIFENLYVQNWKSD